MGTAIAEGLLKLAALTLIWIVAIFCIPLVTKITTNKLTKFFIGLAIVVSLPVGIAFMLAWSKFENQLRENNNHKSVAQSAKNLQSLCENNPPVIVLHNRKPPEEVRLRFEDERYFKLWEAGGGSAQDACWLKTGTDRCTKIQSTAFEWIYQGDSPNCKTNGQTPDCYMVWRYVPPAQPEKIEAPSANYVIKARKTSENMALISTYVLTLSDARDGIDLAVTTIYRHEIGHQYIETAKQYTNKCIRQDKAIGSLLDAALKQ